MRVIPTRLGEREIADDAVISFPHGLIGFEDKRDFVLLRMSDDSPFMLLQSLEDKALGLLVADPFTFIKEYTFKLDNAEKRILDSPDLSALAVLVTVSIPNNQPDKTTLNLSGPIVINSAAKVGIQSPQIDSAFPARLRLVDAK